jgi:hypothetical protein
MKNLLFCVIALIGMYALSGNAKEVSKTITWVIHERIETIPIDRLTVYNAEPSQTDDSPLLTAPSWKIDVDKLNDCSLHWLAVSQKMIREKIVAYGDTVYVETGYPEADGLWIVADCMNKMWDKEGKYGYCADLLIPKKNNKYSHGMWKNVKITKRKVTIQKHEYYE